MKRPLTATVKVGYREIVSIILLSGAFWLAVLPIFTSGAAVLSLAASMRSIYDGTAPSGERARLRAFAGGVRSSVVRGLPITAILVVTVGNTVAYTLLGIAGQVPEFLLAGLAGLYLCLLVTVFVSRVAHLEADAGDGLLAATRATLRSWRAHPHVAVVHLTIVALCGVVSFAFPVFLLFLLPGGAMLLEITSHTELRGENPTQVLSRYRMPA
ncbi:hypothetical protein [Natronobiforma cellulositropha]|uniref:hypothetical protein n=1 Tax=Natronobiforma cellulositropha TaxID=1679076 RepID=UPI0021D601CE|nr:hypothetical protein [Natronobiforma cellulositropha]